MTLAAQAAAQPAGLGGELVVALLVLLELLQLLLVGEVRLALLGPAVRGVHAGAFRREPAAKFDKKYGKLSPAEPAFSTCDKKKKKLSSPSCRRLVFPLDRCNSV